MLLAIVYYTLLVCFVMTQEAAGQSRMVFAHYMLKLAPLYGDDVAGFSQEIRLAQSHGIDAFALNTPFWTDSIQARADAIYEAASTTSFKLFFSADFNTGDPSNFTTQQLTTMLTRYHNHPSQLAYQGKQFFSTFQGTSLTASDWLSQVFTPAGGSIFFVPCFLVASAPSSQITSTIQQDSSVLNGLLAWDASGWPYVGGTLSDASDKAYMQACQDAGIVYMASMSPWFFNSGETPTVRGNYAGDGLWRQHWESLIQTIQPPLIEILTWNDWIERTYIVNVSTDINTPSDASANNDVGFPHQAYMDMASRYYIPWYKTGQKPTIQTEAMYMFYYTQSKTLGGSLAGVSSLEDKVYVTVLLNEAADVVITSGSQTQTFNNLQAGMQSVSMAFSPGQQSAVLQRNGGHVLSVTGSIPISSSPSSLDYNVYSTFATM